MCGGLLDVRCTNVAPYVRCVNFAPCVNITPPLDIAPHLNIAPNINIAPHVDITPYVELAERVGASHTLYSADLQLAERSRTVFLPSAFGRHWPPGASPSLQTRSRPEQLRGIEDGWRSGGSG